jgi:hypothetical protein
MIDASRNKSLVELNAATGLTPAHVKGSVLLPDDLHQEARTATALAPPRRRNNIDAHGIAPAATTVTSANANAETTMTTMRMSDAAPVASSKDAPPLTPCGARSLRWRKIAAATGSPAAPWVALPVATRNEAEGLSSGGYR